MGHQVGYIRVSSIDQNTDRQLSGIELNKTFSEKISGKDINRPQLQECLEYLREGDTLHVHSIDRLARNLADLQGIVADLTGRGISVKFHKENLIFTGDDNAIQKLQLQMMGAFSEFERSLIRERQREGIAAAKAQGKQIGAAPKLSQETLAIIKQRLSVHVNKKELAAEFGISRTTLYKIIDGEYSLGS